MKTICRKINRRVPISPTLHVHFAQASVHELVQAMSVGLWSRHLPGFANLETLLVLPRKESDWLPRKLVVTGAGGLGLILMRISGGPSAILFVHIPNACPVLATDAHGLRLVEAQRLGDDLVVPDP